MTDQQTSQTNITEALDVAAQVAYEMSVFLHGAEMAPPVAPGWLAKIREWQARLADEPRSDAVTAPDEPTLRAAVSAAWAALRNDVLNPDSPFPASVDDLFRVGRYNVERAYDALIEARAAWASPDERTTNPSEVGTPLVVGTAPDEPSTWKELIAAGRASGIEARAASPSPAPYICPDCHEPIIGAAHWHEPAPAAETSEQSIRNEYYDLGFEDGMRAALAKAASPSPAVAPLDVDVLAKVLERMEIDCDPAANILHSTCDHDEQAIAFARAYAEASEQAASPGEGER